MKYLPRSAKPKKRRPIEFVRPEVTSPRSMMRLLALLDTIARAPNKGLSLAELAVALKTPVSSVNNLLLPLVNMGYVTLKYGCFKLGPSSFRLAGSIMSVLNFSNKMHPFVKELAVRTGESAYLGVLDGVGKVVRYVDAIESPFLIRYSVSVGAVQPLYCTGAGRVLLAFVDTDWQNEYISTSKLEAQTPHTISTQKGLRQELEIVRKTHISISIGEMFLEAASISAPVFGAGGKIAAAIAVGGLTARVYPRIDELRTIIADVATRASRHDWEPTQQTTAALSFSGKSRKHGGEVMPRRGIP